MLIVALLFVLVMVVAILWSVFEGISLMVQLSKGDRRLYRGACRLLAWNLLEPGITSLWILFNIAVLKYYPRLIPPPPSMLPSGRPRFSFDWTMTPSLISIVVRYLWPMVILLIGVPLLGLLSSCSENRQAGQKALALGAGRIALTVLAFYTLGIASIGGVCLLYMSVMFIRRWTDELNRGRVPQQVFEQNGVRILPLIPEQKGPRVITIRGQTFRKG